MSATEKHSVRRAQDELSTENQGSTTHVVVALRNRDSNKAVGDALRESPDCVDEVERPVTIRPRDVVGGEVLLW